MMFLEWSNLKMEMSAEVFLNSAIFAFAVSGIVCGIIHYAFTKAVEDTKEHD